ncbi:DNA topoisomerase VI subunit B [Salinibaculum rarum]|uniref:DNA topoisomerase VI subunit B n=1 Tax=Salinibaculum rarum TaxID=3058903 RepID=UPI00265DB091|nr:DNA topoisomerase VI subunit B [Salinibaculum sp. KK48]
MESRQTTITDDQGIAEELAEDQQEISIAEFFDQNRQMLGFDSEGKSLVTSVKEAVDNALDACEEANILPEIHVTIEKTDDGYYRLIVEDNGPGVTREEIPKIFGKLLYGSRFHSRAQTRGQQGIGISAAVMYAQQTSGKPAKITSQAKGSDTTHYYELIIDTDTNEPDIKREEKTEWEHGHGTRIEMQMEGNMRARQQLHSYIKYTAVTNPHAHIEFTEPKAEFNFERATDELPPETEEIPPHPHGIELGALQSLLEVTDSYSISGFLQQEFTRVGEKTADSIVTEFKDRYYGRAAKWSPPTDTVGVTTNGTITPSPDSDAVAASTEEQQNAESSVREKPLKEVISDVVRNKAAEEVNDFTDTLVAEITATDAVSYDDVSEIVTEAAEAVESGFGTRFGSTVRENAADVIWETIIAQRRNDLQTIVDDVTTKRKSDAVIATIADEVDTQFNANAGQHNRATRKELREYVDAAADKAESAHEKSVGATARENITTAIWERMTTVPNEPPKLRDIQGSRDTESNLLDAMHATDVRAPPSNCLAPINPEKLEAGLREVYDADFYATATRDASVHGGDPFIAEAGIAYGGDLAENGSVETLRFANRVPLVYQRGACAITDVVENIGWRNYGLSQSGGTGLPQGPAVIVVHIASTNVPFTSESKDAVANVPEIEDEVELAIREAARDLKSYLNEQKSIAKRKQKQEVISDILPELAGKAATIAGGTTPDDTRSRARILNNLFVTTDDDTLRLENFDNSSKITPKLTINTTANVGSNEDTDITTTPEGVTWTPTVPSGGQATLSVSTLEDITLTGVSEAKVTTSIETLTVREDHGAADTDRDRAAVEQTG